MSRVGNVGRAVRAIVRFLIGLFCVSLILGGINLLRLGDLCPAVRFVETPKVEFLLCVPRGTRLSISSGSLAALLIVPALLVLLFVSRHFLADMWWRNTRGTPVYTVERTFDLPPARVPVVVPGATAVCPWCAEPVDPADLVCRSCNGALPQLRGAVPPPADEWAALRATHPHAVGPVLHSAEQIPKDQWPADAHAAIDRACGLFTQEGLDANRAVQRAFEEAGARVVPQADGSAPEAADRGDEPPAPSLPPRLPPR